MSCCTSECVAAADPVSGEGWERGAKSAGRHPPPRNDLLNYRQTSLGHGVVSVVSIICSENRPQWGFPHSIVAAEPGERKRGGRSDGGQGGQWLASAESIESWVRFLYDSITNYVEAPRTLVEHYSCARTGATVQEARYVARRRESEHAVARSAKVEVATRDDGWADPNRTCQQKVVCIVSPCPTTTLYANDKAGQAPPPPIHHSLQSQRVISINTRSSETNCPSRRANVNNQSVTTGRAEPKRAKTFFVAAVPSDKNFSC
ncbi:hypothetical protein J6590_061551 [Homalodisca vitripennis]|nr:hypothetical protein J6590_061551 [Homalodisca vitripennis]